ncbi:hypothetical protein H310_08927 [Aphanomyces invadans]|uniref:CW-type domain-containing protein n=1 Tax=Aphanomyces invadans TaxID=157072 RepID=A0A024TVZ7_9STRA|nr:hypothetical protein H310_08927 [Aphanomyces invadans]ETV98203.1 hypothetical protein H310_08927 [Aphanomyces invadans]|eukprot:XP_008873078.1 hypothetical protein H310_08927 [Aphanomyces invadans]
MADSDGEMYDSSSPRSSHYDDWTKEPLVGEKMTVYLLHWDKATQKEPDIFDTTLMKPKDPTTIFRCEPDCVIHYHSTTLTRAQFEREYGMPPRSRGDEILRLRQAMLEKYLTEVEMDRKKRRALNQNDLDEDHNASAVVPAARCIPEMSPLDRLKYVTSLWPSNMPNFPDADDSLRYYGFQVGIYIDANDEKAVKDKNSTTCGDSASPADSSDKNGAADTSQNDSDSSKRDELAAEAQHSPNLPPALPVKEENWVQCDKCQKWRKLPDSVDVSALPTTWYCRMNKWSRKYNKCSAIEETTAAPSVALLESDLQLIRERKFVHQFGQRLKRMEKALAELKYIDMKEDSGTRKYVVCEECGKKRPLLGGMDPERVPKPFVCWMNRWDEIHASCSAPQGILFDRVTAESMTCTASTGSTMAAPAAGPDKKQSKQGKKQGAKHANRAKAKKKAVPIDEGTKESPPPPPPLYSSSDEDGSTRKKPRRDDSSKKK